MRRYKITMLLLLCAVVVFACSCGRTTIKANDYLTINVEGTNTAGIATYKIDYEKMIEDNLEAFGLASTDGQDALAVLINVGGNLDGQLDKTEGLENEDVIVFTWNTSNIEKIEKAYNLSFELKKTEYTVSGLKDAEIFDPFDYLEVVFEGISPDGTATMHITGDIPVPDISFKADKNSNLSNGDTITIAFGGAYCKEICFKRGFVPSALEKTYTVDGLASYIQKLSDIPGDAYDKMNTHAQDVLKAQSVEKWQIKDGLVQMELIGNYLLTPKDATIWTLNKNILYFVYRVTAKDPNDTSETATFDYYYYYASYADVMLLEDGTCSFNLGSVKTPQGYVMFGISSGEAFSVGKYYFQGYEDIDSLFNVQVVANIDKFNYENTVTE